VNNKDEMLLAVLAVNNGMQPLLSESGHEIDNF